MNLKTKTILFQGKNIPLSVSSDNKERFWRIDAFGGQDYQVEFSVDLTQPFDERNWEHLPDLLAFLDENLPQYLERSLHALPIFAELSGGFDAEKLKNLEFEFDFVVQIPDNWACWHEAVNKKQNRWEFELIFAENNHDDAGKYIVSFSGKLLSGIRRTIY